MTYTIELTDDEAARVQNAERLGINVSGLMRSVVSDLPAANGHAPHRNGASKNGASATTLPASHENDFQRLIRAEQEALAKMTPEDQEAAQAEWEDIMASLNAERDLVGARRVL